MKACAISVMAAIFISIIMPLHFTVPDHSCSNDTFLVTLDVCDASTHFLSSNSNAPLMHESLCSICNSDFAGIYEDEYSAFNTLLIVYQKERPPKA